MKRIIITATMIFAFIAFAKNIRAQVRVGVNVNIGAQPAWVPAGYAEYYYLPDIDAYYYVPRRQFVYLSNGRWTFSAYLPTRYRNYDLYSGYKVAVREPRPYLHSNFYRSHYGGHNHWQRRSNYDHHYSQHGHRYERNQRHHGRH